MRETTFTFPITLTNQKKLVFQYNIFQALWKTIAKEFLSLSISSILRLAYYIWKSTLSLCYAIPFFPFGRVCMLVYLHFEKAFSCPLERSLWT